MSYDFALENPCPHQVIREVVSLDYSFQQTIRFQRPPFGQNVTLYINGVIVPPSGLYSTASLPFSNPEPYRIIQGQSDLLYFQVGQNAPIFVQLNSGFAVSAAALAQDLNNKLPGLSITTTNSVNAPSRVVMGTQTQVNGRAFTFVDPRWSDKTSSLPTTSRVLGAYNSLGIVPGRVVSGYKLFPGWQFAHDPQSPLETDRIIQLNEPLRNAQPILQANYFTTAANCRRCFGTRIEFDYDVLAGTYETVENADLLAQEFDKFLITELGSHWKWPWLGSNLVNRIGGKGTTGITNAGALLTSDVTTAFATYQSIKQQQDANYPFQMVADAEYPVSIQNVIASPAANDPTIYLISAGVVTRSTTPVTLTRVIGQPNPLSVLSSNPAQNLLFAGNVPFLFRS
jgi:hypothetical protein